VVVKRPELQHRFFYKGYGGWTLHPARGSFEEIKDHYRIGTHHTPPTFIVRYATLRTPIFKELYGDK
jgi:hypothetical protein